MTLAAKPPTQQDVANQAGVSTATVSYVLSGRRDRGGSISVETRARVLDAAHELGYQRNHSARSLRRRRTEMVAVVHRPPWGPWSDRLVHQLHEAALPLGYSVITMPAGTGDLISTTLKSLREQHVDGAILTPLHDMPPGELALLARNGLALVVFDDVGEPDGFDVVRHGQTAACHEAVTHLVERGHRRIAFFGQMGYGGQVERNARYDGYVRALRDHAIPVDESLMIAAADSRPDAFRVTSDLLGRADAPTALFSASDRGALAAIWAAQQHGAMVPDDLAVVGVGNTDEAAVITPTLTSVGSAGFDFTTVVDRLFQRVTAERPIPDAELQQTWRLIRRQSS